MKILSRKLKYKKAYLPVTMLTWLLSIYYAVKITHNLISHFKGDENALYDDWYFILVAFILDKVLSTFIRIEVQVRIDGNELIIGESRPLRKSLVRTESLSIDEIESIDLVQDADLFFNLVARSTGNNDLLITVNPNRTPLIEQFNKAISKEGNWKQFELQ